MVYIYLIIPEAAEIAMLMLFKIHDFGICLTKLLFQKKKPQMIEIWLSYV